jgi:DNA (cytosine-5)-methyltransferase 1
VTAVDLFCGAGGVGLGLRAAGLVPLGVDVDAAAVDVYRAAVGEAVVADVTAIEPRALVDGPVRLLWASPPCPPWSIGRRATGKPMGLDAPDGKLLFEPVRWAEAIRPEWVVVENVGSLPTWASDELCARLTAIGYWTTVLRADARAYVPQRRDHVFVVGGPTVVALTNPSGPPPRFADIRDGAGAAPVTPAAFRFWLKKEWTVPVVDDDGVLPTVTTRAYARRWTCAVYDGDGRYRFPTFREAMRAQGFPDDHPLYAVHERAKVAAWRMVGNAVPVPLARAVAAACVEAVRYGSERGIGGDRPAA